MPFKTLEQQKKELGNILSNFINTVTTVPSDTSLCVTCDNEVVAKVLRQHFTHLGYATRDAAYDIEFYIDLVEPTITIIELTQKITKFNEAYPQYSTSTMDAFVDFLGMERPQ